jgi:hypothetical protein
MIFITTVSVSDLDSSSPDPDPAFKAEYSRKKKLDIFWIKNCNFLIQRPP